MALFALSGSGCPIRFLYFPTAGNWLSSFSILIPTLGKWLFFNSHCENWFNSIFPLLGIEWIQISYCRELIKLIHNMKSHYKKMIDFYFLLRELIEFTFPNVGNWLRVIIIWNPNWEKSLIPNSHSDNWLQTIFPLEGNDWF